MGFKQATPVNGAVAANNGLSTQVVYVVDDHNKLHSASWTPNVGRTVAQATTITLDIYRMGVKLCTAFTLTFAAAAAYAGLSAYYMTPTATETQLLCAPGDVLVFSYQQGATGQAIDAGLVSVDNRGAYSGSN